MVTQDTREKPRTRIISMVETALFVAIAFVLSYVMIWSMPMGGNVTLLSMLPIVIIGLRRGKYWSLCGALIYSGLQMLQTVPAPPTPDFVSYLLVILLDYVAAFGVLGVSGFFPKSGKGALIAVPVCVFARFLCHFVSGIVIWHEFAGDLPVWLYSLVYNGEYMLPEFIASTAAIFVLVKSKALFFGIKEAGKQYS